MIRLDKPVKLLEWGEGTNTLNQRWEECGQGKILSCKRNSGITIMVVELSGSLQKKNLNDDSIKVVQINEGMTPRAIYWIKVKPRWGEVAVGKLGKVENARGKSKVYIEISAATKVGLTFERDVEVS